MRIDTVGKDMQLILGLGASSEVPLEATAGVANVYAKAAAAGFDAQDMAALFRFLQSE
jgi:3-hydroxyisobutyrate dehydrogenase-like beta-hydroxyacid dehydrogenase